MAQLPQLRKVLLEDVKTQRSWIQPLLLVINNFIEAVVQALTKSLTIVDNTTGDIKTLTFTVNNSGTVLNLPVSSSWTKAQLPDAVIVANALRADGTTFTLASAIGIQWAMSSDNNSIQITNIVGLPTPSATADYDVTLVCFAG